MRVVYHQRYLEVYSSDPAAAPGRIESIYSELFGHFEFTEPRSATEDEIRLFHSQSHLEHVKTYPPTYQLACLAAGGAIKAAEFALETEPAFALIRPPGHHASHGSSWGFCYFNNVALALESLYVARKLERALIVDFDLHYGDGTADYASRSMAKIAYFHPEAPNRQAYVNEATRYLAGLDEHFDVLAVSAGFDRHEEDWGGMLTTDDYHIIGKILKHYAENRCDGRRFAVLEGGYNHSVLGNNVRSFLDGFE